MRIMVAVVFCNNFAPTVAIINIGPAVEQKLQTVVAVSLSKELSAIACAPAGYPHNTLVKKTLSQSTPKSSLVAECLLVRCSFNVRVVNTINGNNAGSTLYAHTVIPSTKLCIYFVGAEINMTAVVANSSVDVARKYFTLYYTTTLCLVCNYPLI